MADLNEIVKESSQVGPSPVKLQKQR